MKYCPFCGDVVRHVVTRVDRHRVGREMARVTVSAYRCDRCKLVFLEYDGKLIHVGRMRTQLLLTEVLREGEG